MSRPVIKNKVKPAIKAKKGKTGQAVQAKVEETKKEAKVESSCSSDEDMNEPTQ